jgi:hypothetical protein
MNIDYGKVGGAFRDASSRRRSPAKIGPRDGPIDRPGHCPDEAECPRGRRGPSGDPGWWRHSHHLHVSGVDWDEKWGRVRRAEVGTGDHAGSEEEDLRYEIGRASRSFTGILHGEDPS